MRSVTNPLPESAGYGVGGVYPAVGVQYILGNVLGVDTVLTEKKVCYLCVLFEEDIHKP